MEFKKDYINYLFVKAINEGNGSFKDDLWLKSIADKIISVDDMVKLTYMVGKTAGLEPLFKYLLYISDKIDKSQVSIFNLRDNFEYDLNNLKKIIKGIIEYRSHKFEEKIEIAVPHPQEEEVQPKSIKIDVTEELEEELQPAEEGMTLIENYDDSSEGEVFELESIDETIEKSGLPADEAHLTEGVESDEPAEEIFELTDEEIKKLEEIEEEEEEIPAEIETKEDAVISQETETAEETEPLKEEPIEEVEIVIKKPASSDMEGQVKEESVTKEAYNTFETKFFENVKILEKLFATVDREGKNATEDKLSEKSIQSLTEIIEITSELLNLSRQLMFDLIADVFFTMNLYFTKAISNPEIIESEKIKLFDSALALVNSLIRGEDYLNYDVIVDKIEKLKKQLRGTEEEKFHSEKETRKKGHAKKVTRKDETAEEKAAGEAVILPDVEKLEPAMEKQPDTIKPAEINTESALFKIKYLVKEFEKSFLSISDIKGEYSRFEALEKISELNHSLRLIAKIASNLKINDVLKLAEVTYVFLKYLKDYRMDLLEAEIQQIVKYVIFTFKMLLTNRKPDDFNVLVQHLNNPVKIFADS